MASDSSCMLLLSELKVVELRHELKKRNIDQMGVKAVLVKRLKKAMISEKLDPNTYKFSVGVESSTPKKSTHPEVPLHLETQEALSSEPLSREIGTQIDPSLLTPYTLSRRKRKVPGGIILSNGRRSIATQCYFKRDNRDPEEPLHLETQEALSSEPLSREIGTQIDPSLLTPYTLSRRKRKGRPRIILSNGRRSIASQCYFKRNNRVSDEKIEISASEETTKGVTCNKLSIECLNTSGKPDSRYSRSLDVDVMGDMADDDGIFSLENGEQHKDILDSSGGAEKDQIMNLDVSKDSNFSFDERMDLSEGDLTLSSSQNNLNLSDSKELSNNSKINLCQNKVTASFSILDEHPIRAEPDFNALREVDSEEGENYLSALSNYNFYKKMSLNCEDTDLKKSEAIHLGKAISPNLYFKSDGKNVNTLFNSSDDEVTEVLNLDYFSDEVALLERKDSMERRDGKHMEKTKKFPESRCKGDELHCSPDKGDIDEDGNYRNLWVCNLSSITRATDLKNIFSKYGKVVAAKIVTNAKTPGALYYGFVSMATPEDAFICANVLNATELHGELISVEVVANKPSSTGRTEDKKKSDDKKLTHEKPSLKKREKKDEYFNKEYRAASEEETRRREERCDRQRDNKRKREADSISRLLSSKSSRDCSRERLRNSKDRPLSIKDGLSSRPSHQKKTPPRGALSFNQNREERERHRLYEPHRKLKETEERRLKEQERQEEIERRNNEEALRLMKECALERERIDIERAELQRERERIEREREDLFKEARRLKREAVSDYDIPRKRPALDAGRHFDSRKSPPMFDPPHRDRSSDIRKEVLRGGRETERSDRVAEYRERDRTRRDVGLDHSSNIKERIPERISGTNTYKPSDGRIPEESSDSSGSSSSHHYRNRYESSVSRDLKDGYPRSSSDISYRKATTGYSGSSTTSGTKSSFPSNPPSSSCIDEKDISSWKVGPHSSDRWPGGMVVYPNLRRHMATMGIPGPSAPFQAVDRHDAYKALTNNLARK